MPDKFQVHFLRIDAKKVVQIGDIQQIFVLLGLNMRDTPVPVRLSPSANPAGGPARSASNRSASTLAP